MGRTPSKNPRVAETHMRHTPEEKAEWQTAADAQGVKLTEFVRVAVRHYIEHLKKRKK